MDVKIKLNGKLITDSVDQDMVLLDFCRKHNCLTLLPQTFGCHIPEELGREVLRHKDDPKAVREIGTEWAVAQSRELVEAGVPVLHYYPMGKADNIIKIAKAIF